MTRKLIQCCGIIVAAISLCGFVAIPLPRPKIIPYTATPQVKKQMNQILRQSYQLHPDVLALGLRSHHRAVKWKLTRSPILTIVDYSIPSSRRRLWVINLKTNQVLFFDHVAQGKTTGLNYAHHFSNKPGSDASSIGTYLTGHAYYGKHGYAMRLHGLADGFNDKAFVRDIVVHQAWYVSAQFNRKYHRLGRSWGCMALSSDVYRNIIKTIKDGTIILAYYPDKKWLAVSKFVRP